MTKVTVEPGPATFDYAVRKLRMTGAKVVRVGMICGAHKNGKTIEVSSESDGRIGAILVNGRWCSRPKNLTVALAEVGW